jgi:hypothetical protein
MLFRLRITMEWQETDETTVILRSIRAVSAHHAMNKAIYYTEKTPIFQDRVVHGGWKDPRLSVDILEITP